MNLVDYNTKTIEVPVDLFEAGALQGECFCYQWKVIK